MYQKFLEWALQNPELMMQIVQGVSPRITDDTGKEILKQATGRFAKEAADTIAKKAAGTVAKKAATKAAGTVAKKAATKVAGKLAGAATGAATGAAVGSVIPGAGTAVGTVLGAVGGLFGDAAVEAVLNKVLENKSESTPDNKKDSATVSSTSPGSIPGTQGTSTSGNGIPPISNIPSDKNGKSSDLFGPSKKEIFINDVALPIFGDITKTAGSVSNTYNSMLGQALMAMQQNATKGWSNSMNGPDNTAYALGKMANGKIGQTIGDTVANRAYTLSDTLKRNKQMERDRKLQAEYQFPGLAWEYMTRLYRDSKSSGSNK